MFSSKKHVSPTPRTVKRPKKCAILSSSSNKRKRQCFSSQKTGQKQKTFNELTQCLQRLSAGSPMEELLGEYLNHTRKGKEIVKKVIEEKNNKKLENLITNIKYLHNNSKPIDRKTILSTLARDFTREELEHKYRFSIGKKAFTKPRKIAKISPGRYIKKNNNTNRLSPEKLEAIENFYFRDNITREAANRSVLIEEENGSPKKLKLPVPVRYLQSGGLRNAHEQYQQEHLSKNLGVSLSSFKKYKPKEIKKAKRDSDLCNICVEGKKISARVKKLSLKENLTKDEKEQIKVMKGQESLYIEHRKLEKTIREEFNQQKETLLPGDAMMVMDFKENMHLGRGQQEASRDFYDTPHRSIFCIAIYTREPSRVNGKKGKLEIKYFDFISDCLNHDTQFVFDCIHMLFNSEFSSNKFIDWSFDFC